MANEKQLIDAKPLMQNGWHLVKTGESNRFICSMSLADVPTVDAVEVVHGLWEYHDCVSSYDGTKSGYSCSECHAFVDEEIFDMDGFHKDFCGSCGAIMDGGNAE